MLHNNEIPVGRAKDIRGWQYGRWTVLYRVANQGKYTMWHCKCDCGNERDVRQTSLSSGVSRSCGCLHKEVVGSQAKKRYKDLTGMRFGKLIVIEPTAERRYGNIIWECKCDCGNTVTVPGEYLISGDTKSCGCLKSYGELQIQKLLREDCIYFEQQKHFPTCKLDSGRYAYFDFYINNSYLIEFDGEQHFHAGRGWNTEKAFEEIQKRDAYKNQWCKENHIPLIRIPYTRLPNLCIEDLKIESSQFVI